MLCVVVWMLKGSREEPANVTPKRGMNTSDSWAFSLTWERCQYSVWHRKEASFWKIHKKEEQAEVKDGIFSFWYFHLSRTSLLKWLLHKIETSGQNGKRQDEMLLYYYYILLYFQSVFTHLSWNCLLCSLILIVFVSEANKATKRKAFEKNNLAWKKYFVKLLLKFQHDVS